MPHSGLCGHHTQGPFLPLLLLLDQRQHPPGVGGFPLCAPSREREIGEAADPSAGTSPGAAGPRGVHPSPVAGKKGQAGGCARRLKRIYWGTAACVRQRRAPPGRPFPYHRKSTVDRWRSTGSRRNRHTFRSGGESSLAVAFPAGTRRRSSPPACADTAARLRTPRLRGRTLAPEPRWESAALPAVAAAAARWRRRQGAAGRVPAQRRCRARAPPQRPHAPAARERGKCVTG